MSSIGGVVKSIQNIMRMDVGVDGDAQRIGQMVWLFFLKILDDAELEQETLDPAYRSPLESRFRWSSWAADEEGITGDELLKFVDIDLFPYFKEKLVDTDQPTAVLARSVFEDAYNYMKNGTLLRQVVNKINEIDFNRNKDRQVFGQVYERILSDLQSAGNAGEYYTPRAVTNFMAEMVNPRLGEVILDPACGTGGFLTAALERVRAHDVRTPTDEELLSQSVRGVEKKPLPHLLCLTNMVLHGIRLPDVRRGNTLARPLREYGDQDRVDVILTNPPFGGYEEEGVENNFPAMFQTRETADLFLALIVHLLRNGGRGAVIVPDGAMTGSGVKARVKQRLMEECNLHTVVRLPKGVFNPYTDIKTNILFFDKGQPTETTWFFEHRYPEGYKSYSKTKPITIDEFDSERSWWSARTPSDQSWPVSLDEIRANGFNLDFANPNRVDSINVDAPKIFADAHSLRVRLEDVKKALRAELTRAAEESSVMRGSVNGQKAWEWMDANLPRITGTPQSVGRIKKGVRQLAIRGALGAQSVEDEPASALVSQIQDWRTERATEGRRRKAANKVVPVMSATNSSLLPAGWVMAPLGELVFLRDAERIPLSRDERSTRSGPYPYHGAGGVLDHIDGWLFEDRLMLLGEDGTIGAPRIVEGQYWVNNHAHVLEAFDDAMLDYLCLALAVVDYTPYTTGTAQPKLSQGRMARIPIAVPPLEEQRRIVQRVRQLDILCGEISDLLVAVENFEFPLVDAAINDVVHALDGEAGGSEVIIYEDDKTETLW